jgi:hypothetical protein
MGRKWFKEVIRLKNPKQILIWNYDTEITEITKCLFRSTLKSIMDICKCYHNNPRGKYIYVKILVCTDEAFFFLANIPLSENFYSLE